MLIIFSFRHNKEKTDTPPYNADSLPARSDNASLIKPVIVKQERLNDSYDRVEQKHEQKNKRLVDS